MRSDQYSSQTSASRSVVFCLASQLYLPRTSFCAVSSVQVHSFARGKSLHHTAAAFCRFSNASPPCCAVMNDVNSRLLTDGHHARQRETVATVSAHAEGRLGKVHIVYVLKAVNKIYTVSPRPPFRRHDWLPDTTTLGVLNLKPAFDMVWR